MHVAFGDVGGTNRYRPTFTRFFESFDFRLFNTIGHKRKSSSTLPGST